MLPGATADQKHTLMSPVAPARRLGRRPSSAHRVRMIASVEDPGKHAWYVNARMSAARRHHPEASPGPTAARRSRSASRFWDILKVRGLSFFVRRGVRRPLSEDTRLAQQGETHARRSTGLGRLSSPPDRLSETCYGGTPPGPDSMAGLDDGPDRERSRGSNVRVQLVRDRNFRNLYP
jgi:hypothetical protein